MSNDPGVIKTLIEYAWAAVIGLIGIVYKLNADRITAIERSLAETLGRKEFEDYAERAERSRMEVREAIGKLFEAQSRTAEALARIEGKLEK